MTSSGNRPGQGWPVSVTIPGPVPPGVLYCGYWNSQLHWYPVTFTVTSGFGGSLSM